MEKNRVLRFGNKKSEGLHIVNPKRNRLEYKESYARIASYFSLPKPQNYGPCIYPYRVMDTESVTF